MNEAKYRTWQQTDKVNGHLIYDKGIKNTIQKESIQQMTQTKLDSRLQEKEGDPQLSPYTKMKYQLDHRPEFNPETTREEDWEFWRWVNFPSRRIRAQASFKSTDRTP